MRMKISNTGFWGGSDAHLFHGYSQPLINWIINFLSSDKDKQLYDFGCGTGQYLSRLKKSGFTKLIGFEGDPPLKREFDDIKRHDLTKPLELQVKGNVICLEVAEHIPVEFEKNFIENITNACDNKLIMSWAVRGQGGDGHVNCLDNHEAILKIVDRGFIFLEKETEDVRALIDPSKCDIGNGDLPWFHSTTLIFKKDK